jgi:hypothetical protein
LLVWCLIIFPRIGLAQESVTDTLRKQIGDMQEQLKKALDRIDQLEREKSASSARSARSKNHSRRFRVRPAR